MNEDVFLIENGDIPLLVYQRVPKYDGPWKLYLLSNMAILDIYVRFQGGIISFGGQMWFCS